MNNVTVTLTLTESDHIDCGLLDHLGLEFELACNHEASNSSIGSCKKCQQVLRNDGSYWLHRG